MRDTKNIIKGIIIVEGADCTGKTTLTNLLRKKFKDTQFLFVNIE